MNARLAGLALGVGMAAALVGCSLTQTALRKGDVLGSAGRLITPKRCRMDVVILSRPQGDSTINEALWSVADEQVVEASKRQILESNGFRFGIITGELPSQVQELMKVKTPERPDVLTVINPVGTPNLIDPGQPQRAQLSLFLSLSGQKVKGKPYTDAKGFLRLTPTFDDAEGINLRVVPELHHGPILSGYGMVPQPTGLAAPAEFQIRNGQKEDSFRELAVSLDLRPNQVAVLGCRPERLGSLGDVMFQRTDGNSDRMMQSVVLVWARQDGGTLQPAEPDRPETPETLTPIDPTDFGHPDAKTEEPVEAAESPAEDPVAGP